MFGSLQSRVYTLALFKTQHFRDRERTNPFPAREGVGRMSLLKDGTGFPGMGVNRGDKGGGEKAFQGSCTTEPRRQSGSFERFHWDPFPATHSAGE